MVRLKRERYWWEKFVIKDLVDVVSCLKVVISWLIVKLLFDRIGKLN